METKTLITGASGFIGSYLAKHFNAIPLPHQVLNEYWRLYRFIQENKFDSIIHCSAYGNMAHQKNIDECINANIINTKKLLEATKNINYKFFIYISTSSVYGKKNEPMKETDVPQPISSYAVTKYAAELICRHYAFEYKKPISVARLFSVYGPGEADFRFIPTLINNTIAGKQINLTTGRHDWVYIDDVISAIKILSKNTRTKEFITANIGTGIHLSNHRIAENIGKIAGKKQNIKKVDLPRPYDSPVWVAGNDIIRLMGWRPQVSIDHGLRRVYESIIKKNN